MFVDRVTIRVRAGNGGPGCVSFRRERNLAKGGPDGGNGGHGGSVILEANENTSCLAPLRFNPQYVAENGRPGSGQGQQGRNGQDIIVPVPCGTLVRLADSQEQVADLDVHGAQYKAAQGGQGGVGNRSFASSTNQIPREATPGTEGSEAALELELKIVADIGLVGYPNAGKSTLLSALTGAEPETAAYPFTTLTPNIGVMSTSDYETLTLADIPGLIEGAHQNVGLGHAFLRHIERTRALAFVLDLAATDGVSPADALSSLREELEHYLPGLSQRPSIIIGNKIDEPMAAENLEELREFVDVPVYPICAILEEGTDVVRVQLKELLARAKQELAQADHA